MRIGILTFHNALNYGAVLQTYATQKLFEHLGHKVEVIDYRNVAIEESYLVANRLHKDGHKSFKDVIAFMILSYFTNKRRKTFDRFRQDNLNISPNKYHIESPNISGYDIILIGSDQVWTTKLTSGFDKFYWGNFEKGKGAKLVAWAASAGDILFTPLEVPTIRNYLNNFTGISVREEKLRSYLSEVSGKDVAQVLDPTLLVSQRQWLELYKPTRKKHYVLVYAVSNEPATIALGKRLARVKGLDYVVITSMCTTNTGKHYKQCLDPSGFISYLNDADYIVACSFHATAFALILQKQFFCHIKEGTHNIRVESMLDKLGLMDRIVPEGAMFTNTSDISYSEVSIRLNEMRAGSMTFVNNTLKQ